MATVAIGIFDKETGVFQTQDLRQYETARDSIGELCYALDQIVDLAGRDVEEIAEYLGIENTIQDLGSLATVIETLLNAGVYVTLDEYEAYVWMISVLRSTLTHGEYLWEKRAVLLDQSQPDDWFIAQTLE